MQSKRNIDALCYDMIDDMITVIEMERIWLENLIRFLITPKIKEQTENRQIPNNLAGDWNHIDPDHTHTFCGAAHLQILRYGIPNSLVVLHLGHLKGIMPEINI